MDIVEIMSLEHNWKIYVIKDGVIYTNEKRRKNLEELFLFFYLHKEGGIDSTL